MKLDRRSFFGLLAVSPLAAKQVQSVAASKPIAAVPAVAAPRMQVISDLDREIVQRAMVFAGLLLPVETPCAADLKFRVRELHIIQAKGQENYPFGFRTWREWAPHELAFRMSPVYFSRGLSARCSGREEFNLSK